MAYQKISPTKISDMIVQELEKLILEGALKPDEKLPSERDLAEQFDVSRPSVRDAIKKLEVKGLLRRRQGGGTYVQSQLWQSFSDPFIELMQEDPESQYDLLEFRHALEGVMAYLAALRGTDSDMEQLKIALQVVEEASDSIEQQAKAIVDFYRTIAEAAHNVAMLHLILSLQPVLVRNVSENLKFLYHREDAVIVAKKHRRDLLAAIVGRDPEGARQASNDHLAYIEEVLLKIRDEDSRMQRSLRRMRGDR